MNEALVVMLALLWAVVLLPGALRSRRVNTQATVGGFERAMDVLRRQPDGRSLMVPEDAGRIVGQGRLSERVGAATAPTRVRREDPAIGRRRTTFVRLLAATGALFVAAVVLGGFAWTLFTLTLGVTAGYAALLRRYKLRRDEVREVVRELRGDEAAEPRHERLPVAVGAGGGYGAGDRYGEPAGVQVARQPDEPWQPMSGVRIRRWDD